MKLRTLFTKLVGDIDTKALSAVPAAIARHKKVDYATAERQLIQQESQIGASLFGAVPSGRRREFFCVDNKNWIWYEEWRDQKGRQQSVTIRYEIQKAGVLKVQEGAKYSYLEGKELDNFLNATNIYCQQVMGRLYGTAAAA